MALDMGKKAKSKHEKRLDLLAEKHPEYLGLLNETPEAWTDRLVHLGASRGVYRQCSIGYHEECSSWRASLQGEDECCKCLCHKLASKVIEKAWRAGDIV